MADNASAPPRCITPAPRNDIQSLLNDSSDMDAIDDDGRNREELVRAEKRGREDSTEEEEGWTEIKGSKKKLSSSAKIDRWFSLLPGNAPALSRPESGFISGVEDGADAATLAEAKNLLLQLGAKKKRRLIPIRFTRRKILVNKHTLL